MGELKSLNKYLLKYKYRLFLGFIFIGLSNWFTIYPAQIFRTGLDEMIALISQYNELELESAKELFIDNFKETFIFFALALVGLAVIKGVFTFLMRFTIIMMSRFIEYDLKNEIYKHYQALDTSFYKKNNTGDIMNRIGDDVSKVRMYLGPSIMYLINMAVLFVLIIWTMLSINVKLSLYVLTPLPLMSVIIYFVSINIGRKSEKVQKELSNVYSYTQEAFSGIRVIKSYNKTERSINLFDKAAAAYRDKSMSLIKTESLFHPVILFLPVLSTLLTIYMGGLAVIDGTITFGNIAEFVIYINLLTWPVASLGWVTSLIQRAKASMKRINEFLDTKPSIVNPSQTPLTVDGEIEFKNVSFDYPENGSRALKNISFTVPKGSTLGLVGKTGSGKSTIIQLLGRIYDPYTGDVLIDGKKLSEINLSDYRDQLGAVPQDSFLFSDTISNNIGFGKSTEENNSEEIKKAASLAEVHDNILRLKDGYDTIVGERGVMLSGGQKQRIAIARALIKEPQILLFDDCLSAVDSETEEKILANLKSTTEGKTAIIVSHRLSGIQHCDHILVLDQGEIIEEGDHQSLMNKKGYYWKTYEEQKSQPQANS